MASLPQARWRRQRGHEYSGYFLLFREAEESMDSPGATLALFPNGTETEVSMPYLMTQGQSPHATRVL